MRSTITKTDRLTPGGTGLSENKIFELLSNRRRRFVIHALKRRQEPLEICELSAHVTAWEQGIDTEDVTYSDRRNVYSTLKRTHLPKLEKNNVITIDEEENLVEPTEAFETLDIYVEVLGSKEIPWSLYYVGLAGISLALLLAVATGTPGFTVLGPLEVGIFMVTAFAVSSVSHHFIGGHIRLGSTDQPPEVYKREKRSREKLLAQESQ